MKLVRMLAPVLSGLGLAWVAASAGAFRANSSEPSASEDLEAVLITVPDLKRGSNIFALCAQCHGASGEGISAASTPRIAGQLPRVLAKQLVAYRHGARWDPRMEHVASRHILESPRDIADVVAYVGELKLPVSASVGTGEWAYRGRHLYEALCSSCHGPGGEGSAARFVPQLAGQRYEYLLRQLHDAIEGRRPSMEGIHAPKLRDLDAQQLEGLADYLSRLSPSPLHGVGHTHD